MGFLAATPQWSEELERYGCVSVCVSVSVCLSVCLCLSGVSVSTMYVGAAGQHVPPHELCVRTRGSQLQQRSHDFLVSPCAS